MTATLTLVPPPPTAAPSPRPQRGALARPRLVAPLLDSGDAAVAVLVAPAGFGKTVAVEGVTSA